MKPLFLLLICLLCTLFIRAQELREYLDLQTHPTMHVAYHFFGKGLVYFEESDKPKLSYKHLFTNVNYANYLEQNPGARIIVNGALNKEWVGSSKKAKKVILKQIDYLNKFVEEHSEKFAVAFSPQQLRDLVAETDKTIFIHSIEGGRKLINSQEDANFWASQGVAFMTLIHLVDDENGAAAIAPGLTTKMINLKGSLRKEEDRKLTEHGKQAILYLANAGIMIDITHMSDLTREDAINFMIENNIPPISTHDGFKPIQNQPRGISQMDIIKIYQNNGFVSLPISGESLHAYNPYPLYRDSMLALKAEKCFCEGSIDSYKFTYLALKNFIESNAAVIAKDPGLDFNSLSEKEKINFAIGFQTDFNGWLNHHRPKFGEEGCYEIAVDKEYEEIELQGLAILVYFNRIGIC